MAGTSDQEKEGQRQNQQTQNTINDIQGGKYTAQNRFNNYTNPFGYNDIQNKLDEMFGTQEKLINQNTAEDIANQQQKAAASLASRGITGGSVLTDTSSKVASDINKTKYNALGQLGIGKASSLSDLMKYFNSQNFATTKAATDVDLSNINNTLSGLTSSYGLQQNNLGAYDNSTWLDDAFAGLGTIAQLGSIPLSGGTSVLGKLLGSNPSSKN